MNPGFYVNQTSYQNAPTDIYLVMTMGASGAVPTLGTGGVDYGVTSVVLSSTSTYTVVFGGAPYGLLLFDPSPVMQATYSKTGACFCVPISFVASTGTLVFETVDAAGDATAASSGDIISIRFTFQLAGN